MKSLKSINHNLQHARRDDQTQARKEGQDEAELDNICGRDNVMEECTKDVSLVRCDPERQSKIFSRWEPVAEGASTAVYPYEASPGAGIDEGHLKLARCNMSSLQLSLPLCHPRLSSLRDPVGLAETY